MSKIQVAFLKNGIYSCDLDKLTVKELAELIRQLNEYLMRLFERD